MKTNKHTAGPWVAAIDPGITTVDNNKCKVFAAKHAFFVVIDGCNYSEGLANARLIASAPEMLEALERMVKLLESIERETGYCTLVTQKDAYKLIKEARGES